MRFGKLVAGELEFTNLRARVMQLDHLQRVFGVPMDGILGFNTFAGMLLTIDWPAGELRVREGRLPPPDAVTTPPTGRRPRAPRRSARSATPPGR